MILYHVSPKRFGAIRASKSQGKKKRLWLVDEDHLQYIIYHLYRHHGKICKYLYEVDVREETLVRMRTGIYTSVFDFVPVGVTRIAPMYHPRRRKNPMFPFLVN